MSSLCVATSGARGRTSCADWRALAGPPSAGGMSSLRDRPCCPAALRATALLKRSASPTNTKAGLHAAKRSGWAPAAAAEEEDEEAAAGLVAARHRSAQARRSIGAWAEVHSSGVYTWRRREQIEARLSMTWVAT